MTVTNRERMLPMFRQATLDDLEQIAAIYDHIHTEEEAGRAAIGWDRAIYPTR